jgi:type IV pilus assembly protein PilM
MLNTKSFLALDFGAGSLKVAEFEQNDAGGLRLKQFGIKALGLEGSQESTREATLLKALQGQLAEKSFSSRQSNVCAPGFHVFSKFVKLPPVDTSKVTQIIRYEAQQNVPFPLEEVVWDYQILGTTATGELEVLLVAVKSEIIEGLFRVGEGAGLRLKLVDVSSAALCNSFRYNYGDLEGCSMLLDIGAKTSNLLFIEKGKVYARSINIGANAITQDFANDAKLKFPEAEAIKIEKGSVSLGGAYEEPEDPQAAAIAKIARQVMTRLHIQVNQTIQFYRGQQGGSAPDRLFLSGGASIMPYTAQFFTEKLNLSVDYFNPFRNIEIDPALDLDELSKYAHSFGEVVGLGLRDLAHCPVELNLMPKSSIQRQEFGQKKPYLIAAVFSLALAIFLLDVAEGKIAGVRRQLSEDLKGQYDRLSAKDRQLQEALNKEKELKAQADALAALSSDHFYWINLLIELRRIMLASESEVQARLVAANGGHPVDVGIWVESFAPQLPEGSALDAETMDTSASSARRIPGRPDPRTAGRPGAGTAAGGRPATSQTAREKVASVKSATGQINQIYLQVRAISRQKYSPTADADIAYTVRAAVSQSSFFTAPQKEDLGNITRNGLDTNLFDFPLTVHLKVPFKL